MAEPKTRVLIADDHMILCEGLKALLSYYADVEVVGDAHTGVEAVACVRDLHPDVVLMDIAMPDMNGIEATRCIRRDYPDTKVLILTQHEDREYVISLLQAGASGYVLKRALGTDLITALHAVERGEVFLYPAVASLVVDEMRNHTDAAQSSSEALTPREREIAAAIAAGRTSTQIAEDLSLSVKTVEWHRGNLMAKLDAHTVADVVRYAVRAGLVDGDS